MFLEQYKGTPFQDSHYKTAPPRIPGRMECAAYDVGGESVAYHDIDAVNHGSGQLNPADGSYLNEFRMHDGDADPIAWRQWHHWNILRNAVTLDLPAGRNVLTVHIFTGGNMNLAYF